jgi:hypothetical protein
MRLNAWNMSDGTVQVHKAGCNHKPGSGRNAHYQQDQVEFSQIDWPTKYAFAHDYWDNGILEESEHELGIGSFDVFAEMDFKPCTKSLPVGSAPVAEAEVPATKTAKKSGSNAVRAEVREVLFNSITTAIAGMRADVENGYQPQEKLDMMIAQSERVAFMFGMRNH